MGYDFTPEVKDQGHCGSCYSFTTVGMLESRIKLWFGVDRPLSTQFLLDCNFLTEGCHGGFGMLNGSFLQAFYTVDEACAPYLQDLNL